MLKLSLPYRNFEPGIEFLSTKQFIYHIKIWRWSFYLHVFVSMFVLLAGMFQFSKVIRLRSPKFHKTCGYIYFSVLLGFSAPSGLVMAYYANGGIWAKTSFILLSLSWIFTTIMALYYLRRKEYEKHGNWTLRSYALTLSAITLRFYAWVLGTTNLQISPVDAYILIAWLSWIPNLVYAQGLIKFGFIRRLVSGIKPLKNQKIK